MDDIMEAICFEDNESQIRNTNVNTNNDEIDLDNPIENIITNELNVNQALNVIFELSDDELNRLEEHLRQKLQKNGGKFFQQHEQLRASYEKFKIEYEQRFIELESEYNECQSKLATETKNSHLFRIKANENDEALSKLTKQLKLLEDEKETVISNNKRLNTVNRNLEAEKRDLHSLLDKRIKENDRLNEEWKSMNIKLADAESKVCELTAKLEEFTAKESTIIFREKQFQSDKQRLLNEIEWLNEQLKEKSSQILEIKGTFNSKVYELESKLEDCLAENNRYKNSQEALQTANQNMENQIEELTKKVQELREREAQNKIDFEEEAESREKLIELYKEESTSCKEKLEEAGKVIEELRRMIDEIRYEYNKISEEKQMVEEASEAKLKEKEENIAKLEQELKNANELLSIAKRKGATVLSESDIEQLSPAAAVASRLLKSDMTLTQIYSEYVNLTESFQNEKKENERLKSYITELVRDIHEKAPIMIRQKQEYEESVKTINSLTEQLEKAMMDYEVLKSKSEDSIKKYNLIYSDNVRLKQDVNYFSRQITVLLHEVEVLRAKLINNPNKTFSKSELNDQVNSSISNLFALNEENNESLAEVTSSSDVLNKNMFLFRNIEELQKQNQELVGILHELKDKKQSEEKIELEQRTKEYNEKLNLALKELEEFRAQREKQEQLLEEISKQRDTYKQLLNQQQTLKQNQLNITSSEIFTSTPGIQRKKTIETGGSENFTDILTEQNKQLEYRLNETLASSEALQKKFEKYQTEMLTTNKMLNEEIETFRRNNSELGLKLALSESKLESALEKCKTLTTTTEKHKKELESSKERISKLNELIIKHEQSINLTTQELNRSKEKLNELETKLHTITVEKDLYKSNQERLSKENELLTKENSSRNSILANLEMIKNSCERNERETKIIFTQKIEQLERNNTILQKEIEKDKENHETIVKSWKSQFESLDDEHQKLKAEYEKAKLSLNETKTEFDKLQEKYNEIEAKLRSNELLVQMTRNTKSSSAISRLTHLEEETKDLNMKLSLADKEIVSLKMQLEETKGHSKQYKTIADSMEKAVKEASEMNEKSKNIYEVKLNELEEQLKSLKEKHETLTNEKNELEQKTTLEKQTSEENIENLNKEKAQLMADLDMLQKRFENTEKILEERTKDRDDYVAKLGILEEQLQQLNENLIQSENNLEDKSNKLNEINLEVDAKNNEIEQYVKAQQELKSNYESNERVMQDSINNLQKENQNLISQINILQQELAKMGQDIIALQNQDSFKLSSTYGSEENETMITDDGQPKSSISAASNLLEINRYLRTQKDQLEEKCENLNLNFEINQQRLKTVENDLEFYRKQSQLYENEIKQLKISIKEPGTIIKSDENQVNLENLNLTINNNRRLKEECDSLTTEVRKLNDEIRMKEEEFINLKASLSASELKNESIMGENVCLKDEIKKWKDRVDALLRSSDMGQEWIKIQGELQEAQDKNQELTDMINELRNNLTDSKAKCDQSEREINELKIQMTNDKTKAQQDSEALRIDKAKREEMFKMLVSELKEVVTTVQRELQMNIDWGGMKGPQSEKLVKIKDELGTIKRIIIEKIEELKNKSKISDEVANEINLLKKKIEEFENKLKEKDTKIGQMNNFINTIKTKLNTQQKTITDQTKEINDLKSSAQGSVHHETQGEQTVLKTQMDSLRSKLLQSQLDCENLKKELQDAKTQSSVSSGTTSQAGQITSSPNKQQTNQTTLTSSSTSQTSTNNDPSGSQPPPTAYIAPSRITAKVQVQPQQTTSSSAPSLRRTAAVQPTPHDSGPVSNSTSLNMQTRQQFVSPFNENNNQWQSSQNQTSSQSGTASELSFDNQQQQSQQQEVISHSQPPEPTSSSIISSTPGTSTSFMTKRNREDDQIDDNLNSSGSFNNFKKQRSSLEQVINIANSDQQVQQNVATIEPFSINPAETENDYIVLGDEMHSNEVQELQEVQQEEIVLDEGTDSDYEDVIITNDNRNQQNSTSSNNNMSNDIQTSNEANIYQDDEDASVETNQGIEEETQENNEETVVDENSVETNNEDIIEDDNDVDNQNRSDEILEMPADEETEENGGIDLRPSSRNEENFQIEEGMSQDNVNKEGNGDSESNNFGDGNNQEINAEEIPSQQAISPSDNSAPHISQQDAQEQQQQQNLQNTSQQETSSQIRGQQTNDSVTGSTFISTAGNRQLFGSSGSLQTHEKPKPIVWDGPPTSVSQFPNQPNPGGSYRIRRTPLTHNMPNFQQQAGAGVQSQTGSQEYFQQQEFQQQQNFQPNQFRLQNNNRFPYQATNLGSSNIIPGSNNQMMSDQTTQQQQLINAQRTLIRNMPRGQLNTQQPGRIIPTINPRGGGNVGNPAGQINQRGGLNRGGGAGPGRGTRPF